jgi:uncharacterized protein (DUF58 family)
MLTVRGWWFLVIVILQTLLGVLLLPYYTVTPAVIGLTLMAWFAWEWAVFRYRMNAAVARLRLSRRIIQGGREVPMVWVGLPFEVRLRVEHDGFARVPFVALEDRLPQAVEYADDTRDANALCAELPPGEPARIAYVVRCLSPGVLRFEGVRVRVADLLGFFYHRGFVRDAAEYLILPPLADDEGRQRADKRFNTLPPPGVHRFRRPGTGSELLDLRDYQPGDPPKMIAWKPSARRDKLITKEYESDVPVRTVLFLDTSEVMRLGPPGNTPLTRMATVASVVAQASAANRDLVGLTTFDEVGATGADPARTKLHMMNLLRRLAQVAVLQPGTKGVTPDQLTRRAYPLAEELYPELMDRRVNTMPLGRLWLPLLDRWWGWIFFWVILLSPLLVFWPTWLGTMIEQAVYLTPRRMFWGLRLALALLLLMTFIFLPATLSLLFWFFYGIRGWFGVRREQLTRRKRLAALLALQDGSGPQGIERLIHDDEAYGERVGRFLQQHQVRMPVPLYDDQGRYRFRCEAKARVLATAIVRAVSRARDNELFVLLADLAELGDDLEPLLKAARVARARKHQVLVLVPWPAEVPSPDEPKPPREPRNGSRDGGELRGRRPPRDRSLAMMPLVQAALVRQYHESFRQLRRAFGRVGATVVRVNEDDPVRMVLDRLDRLRGMRSRR